MGRLAGLEPGEQPPVRVVGLGPREHGGEGAFERGWQHDRLATQSDAGGVGNELGIRRGEPHDSRDGLRIKQHEAASDSQPRIDRGVVEQPPQRAQALLVWHRERWSPGRLGGDAQSARLASHPGDEAPHLPARAGPSASHSSSSA